MAVAPPTYARYAFLAFASFLLTGVYFCSSTPSALNINLQRRLGSSNETFEYQLNTLYSVYSLPNIVLPIVAGGLYDAYPHRSYAFTIVLASLVLAGQVVFSAGVTLRSFPLMVVGRFVCGAGGESMAVAQARMVTRWFLGKELAFAVALTVSCARIGYVIDYNIAPILVRQFGGGEDGAGTLIVLWLGIAFAGFSLLCVIGTWLIEARFGHLLTAVPMRLATDGASLAESGEVASVKQNALSFATPAEHHDPLQHHPHAGTADADHHVSHHYDYDHEYHDEARLISTADEDRHDKPNSGAKSTSLSNRKGNSSKKSKRDRGVGPSNESADDDDARDVTRPSQSRDETSPAAVAADPQPALQESLHDGGNRGLLPHGQHDLSENISSKSNSSSSSSGPAKSGDTDRTNSPLHGTEEHDDDDNEEEDEAENAHAHPPAGWSVRAILGHFWSILQSFKLPYWLLLASVVLFFGSTFAFNYNAPKLLQSRFGLSNEDAGTITSVPDTIVIALSPFIGLFLDMFGFRLTIVVVASILLVFVHVGLSGIVPSIPPLALMCIFGFCSSSLSSALWPTTSLLVAPSFVGRAYALLSGILNATLTIVPIVVAALNQADPTYLDAQLFFASMMVLCLLSTAALWTWDARVGYLGLNKSASKIKHFE